MKTWEMIKELTENPGKKFRLKGETNTIYVSDREAEGKIDLIDVDFIAINDEWEEVKEPVSFTEVLEAVKKKYNTEITFENNRHEVSFERNSLEYILSMLSERYASQEIADILLNSKFYIED